MTIQDISIGMKNCCATKLFCDEMCREIVAVGKCQQFAALGFIINYFHFAEYSINRE